MPKPFSRRNRLLKMAQQQRDIQRSSIDLHEAREAGRKAQQYDKQARAAGASARVQGV